MSTSPPELLARSRIRVYPHTIAGNAIPDNSFTVDQDFALVVYNGTESANIPVLTFNSFSATEELGNSNGAYDPGETFSVQVALENAGTAATDPITASITTTDPHVTITNVATAPAIIPGAAQTFTPTFMVNISVVHVCAESFRLYMNLAHGPYRYTIRLPDLSIGTPSNVNPGVDRTRSASGSTGKN